MNFAEKKTENRRSDVSSVSDFPEILPFEEIDRGFSRRSLDIPQSRGDFSRSTSRRGAGRALPFVPDFGLASGPGGLNGLDGPVRPTGPGGPRPDPIHDLSNPYQFTHVEAPHTFRSGHSR